MGKHRIYLSPPHVGEQEQQFLLDALASNWLAPLGPQVEAFEEEFREVTGAAEAVALSSGTAGLHLALVALGVGAGDEVVVPTFTFAATAFAVRYVGARPVFVDSEPGSWNLDPNLLEELLRERSSRGRLPRAVIVVHIYGQSADLDSITRVCAEFGVPLIEDAAEALGTLYRGKQAGTYGIAGVFSFNGNKIITTSGGGMLVTPDRRLAERVRKLATQAREPAPHYEHQEIGYNYRLSNLLAALGRAQLRALDERVARRRAIFAEYARALGDFPGMEFMPEAPWGRSNRWLTVALFDAQRLGLGTEEVRLALEAEGIEARPVWKPLHRQPVFRGFECIGGKVADELFGKGLCLPSGSGLTAEEQKRVIEVIRNAVEASGKG